MPNSPEPHSPAPRRDPRVVVYAGDAPPSEQPRQFRCCPLGIQIYTRSPVEEFNLLDVDVHLPGNGQDGDGRIQCNGVVVSCRRQEDDDGLYQVWVKFLDLPEHHKQRLQCLKPSGENICPYCANYSPRLSA